MKYHANIAIFALVCSGLCGASPANPPRKPSPQKPQATTPEQHAAEQAVPQPPRTPENMPATAPRVSMNNGLLTIAAENSTLGDVLNGVHTATGASVDVPPAASAERVAVHIGPGEPREVLQQLLTGSKFDYIIVGSPQNDAVLQKVILTPRTGGGPTPPSVMANRQPAYEPPPPDDYQPPDLQEENNVEEPVNEPGAPTPDVSFPPQPAPGQENDEDQQNQQNQQNQQGPKTPEQLLKELQQIRGEQGQQPQRPDRNPQPQ